MNENAVCRFHGQAALLMYLAIYSYKKPESAGFS